MPIRITAKVWRVRGTAVNGSGREMCAQMATSPVAATERAILPERELCRDLEGCARGTEVGKTDCMLRFLSGC
jgi:hypothetical protein